MKNLKNMFTAGILAAVLMVGATSANAGFLLSDRASNNNTQCTQDDTGITGLITGIIVLDFARVGFLLSDRAQPTCANTTGDGFLLSD